MSRNDHFLTSIVKVLEESDRKVKPMTVEKLSNILKSYKEMLDSTANAIPIENQQNPCSAEHLAYMCRKCLEEFIPQQRISKAMRWLGFIQGVLVSRYGLTLDNIRTHSRTVS